jgi:hypothetical protein
MMATIRFPTRIAHATDDQESARYALRGTLVTPDGFAVATDGHLAACVKVEADDLQAPTMVPQELGPKSKTDLKAEYHAGGQLTCEKHTFLKGQRRVEQAPVQDGRYPRVGEILGGLDAANTLVLALNAHYLWRLAQAINVPDTLAADAVILLIPKPQKDGLVREAVGVLSSIDSRPDAGGLGIVMPLDTDAAQARADFGKLREAATASLDAAAGHWNEMYLDRGRTDEEAAKPAEAADKEDTSNAADEPQPKQRGQRRRRRSVA